jgi:hypothetical protein
MFEPQDHPDDIPYPGGTPIPPYDNAGWTLAYQMGVEFDRIYESVEGPFEKIEDIAQPPAGKVTQSKNTVGFLLDHRINDAFIAINRLLRKKEEVYWLKEAFQVEEKTYPAGTIYIPAKSSILHRLGNIAKEIGLNFEGIDSKPSGEAIRLRPVRIGLWDQYGGSIPSGWVRWLLEQFEFRFKVVYPATLDAGNLNKKYDVLIFVRGAIPLSDSPSETRWRSSPQPKPGSIPSEFRKRLGKVTVAKTVPKLLEFIKNGGTLLAISSSTSIGYHAGLPITNALVEKLQDGNEKPIPKEKYFVPGSILQVSVDNTNPLAYGLPGKVDVSFNNSPVFRIKPEAAKEEVRSVAWFENEDPLRSGWAWGKNYLYGGIAVIEADVGQGKLFLYGPEITRRAQPHGTFKFLFNGIYYGGSTTVELK